MTSKAITPGHTWQDLPEDRREAIIALRRTVKQHLPKGFEKEINYGMEVMCYRTKYTPGVITAILSNHCLLQASLPGKFYCTLSHGCYSMPNLLTWLVDEYPKHSKSNLDMGKSCIRFKKPEQIPYKLLGESNQKVM